MVKDIWKRGTYHNHAFWLCLIVSIGLMVTSFFLPPIGIVSSSSMGAASILWAYGALASFNAALSKGVDARVRHGDTELTLTNDDNKKENGLELND